MQSNKDLRVEIRVKNNRLYKLIYNEYGSVKYFSESVGIHPSTVGSYLNMKIEPVDKKGAWKKIATVMAEALKVYEGDIWPDHIKNLKVLSKAIYEVNNEELPSLEAQIDREYALEDLTEKYAIQESQQELVSTVLDEALSFKESFVLAHRFGLWGLEEKTFTQIAKFFSLSSQRIRQIQHRAMCKLQGYMRKRNINVEEIFEYLTSE